MSAYTMEIFLERHITATFDAVSEEPPSSKKLSSIPTFSMPSAFVKFPTKSENNLKYALQTVKNHPSRLLFSQNILNLFQNKSKVFQAS